jgi:polysaccharide biosynthesis PFTS motif protein
MRGYRLLKESNRLNQISKTREVLTEQRLNLTSKDFSPYLMGAGHSSSEIILRQYLLLRIGGLNLNQALLFSLGKRSGKVIYPLPKEWRVTISQHGFKVANIRSSFLWQLYIIGAWLYGVFQIFKIFLSSLISLIHKPVKQKKYVYFSNLSSGNLPQGSSGQKSYDIVSWYLQWKGKIKNIGAIHHSVSNVSTKLIGDIDLVFQQDILPSLSGLNVIFSYAFWGIIASFIALLDCFRGRWWHALILNQAALSKQARCLKPEFLADEYLFHNSGWIYRPLWTYDAEKVGSKITFYFYSTNCENFKTSETDASITYGWKAMSWPHYLVWDNRQADFVRTSVGNDCEISIVGPIWFQSSSVELTNFGDTCIAVFDITPHRKSRYITLGMANEFYTPNVINPFLQQVSNAIFQQGFFMYWKRKRNVGRVAHPLYLKMVDELGKNSHARLIDPDISAIPVIEASAAVISMPFTSTALIAKEMGKPSIYFDPTGLICKVDHAAHGIPVLSSPAELDAWLSEQVVK